MIMKWMYLDISEEIETNAAFCICIWDTCCLDSFYHSLYDKMIA